MSRRPSWWGMRPAPLPAVTVGVVALAGCDAPAPAMDAPPAAPPAVTAPGPVAGDPVADAALGVDIAVEALLERTAPAINEQRNVFQFGPLAGGGRAASVAAAPAASGGAVPGSGEPPGATDATPSPPAPDRVDPMRFIGVVEARNRVGRVAVLTDGDGVYCVYAELRIVGPTPERGSSVNAAALGGEDRLAARECSH